MGNLIVVLGFIGLGFSFWLPQATARRTARVEGWAEDIAARLLRTASEQAPPLSTLDASASAAIHDALAYEPVVERLRPLRADETGDLPPGAYLEGKHYYYAVLRMPVPNTGGLGPLEVYAWPRATLGPARTVFYFAEDRPPAYTHNLRARYAALERVPRPGAGRPETDKEVGPGKYRTADEERWLVLPTNRQSS